MQFRRPAENGIVFFYVRLIEFTGIFMMSRLQSLGMNKDQNDFLISMMVSLDKSIRIKFQIICTPSLLYYDFSPKISRDGFHFRRLNIGT